MASAARVLLIVCTLVGVIAAGHLALEAEMSPAASAVAGVQGSALDRSLLDRYCVTCHNERLLTGGLALDTGGSQRRGARKGHAEAPGEADASSRSTAARADRPRGVHRLARSGARPGGV